MAIAGKDLAIVGKICPLSETIWPLSEKVVGNDDLVFVYDCRKPFGHCRNRSGLFGNDFREKQKRCREHLSDTTAVVGRDANSRSVSFTKRGRPALFKPWVRCPKLQAKLAPTARTTTHTPTHTPPPPPHPPRNPPRNWEGKREERTMIVPNHIRYMHVYDIYMYMITYIYINIYICSNQTNKYDWKPQLSKRTDFSQTGCYLPPPQQWLSFSLSPGQRFVYIHIYIY